MKIQNLPSFNFYNNIRNINNRKLPELQNDSFSLSFTGLKKTDFQGLELMAVEQFKAPLEKFKSKADFETWAKNKTYEILNQDYTARKPEITAQRLAMLQDWHKYLTDESGSYAKKPALILLIMDAVSRNLKPNTDKLPPLLNSGALADSVTVMEERIQENPKAKLSFSNIYKEKLQKMYMLLAQETDDPNAKGVWVKIPSKKNDPENFSANVEKLKALSHPCWCTKSTNAQPYLEQGDFHVYMVDNKPKVGIRLKGDKIKEIQGVRNNSIIPVLYAAEIKKYTESNNLQGAEDKIAEAIKNEQQFLQIKVDLKDAIENKDFVSILNYPAFDCGAKLLDDGFIEVEHYFPPMPFSLSDLGIKENELFDKIKIINGDLCLRGTEITRIKNLKEIFGSLDLELSQIVDTGSLERVYGDIYFDTSKTTLNDNLAGVEGSINAQSSASLEIIKQASKLQKKIKSAKDKGEVFKLLGIPNKKMENGKWKIKEYVPQNNNALNLLSNLNSTPFDAIGMTEEELLADVGVVVGDLNLKDSKLKTIQDIEQVGGNVILTGSDIEDTGALYYVRGNLDVRGSKLRSLFGIRRVDGNVFAGNSNLQSLGRLSEVRGNLAINNTSVRRTAYLKKVLGDIDARYSELEKIDRAIEISGKILMDTYTSETLDEQLWKYKMWIKSEVS